MSVKAFMCDSCGNILYWGRVRLVGARKDIDIDVGKRGDVCMIIAI